MHIADRRTLVRLCMDPDMEFGELYSAGKIQVEGDLGRMIEAVVSGLGQSGPQLGHPGASRGALDASPACRIRWMARAKTFITTTTSVTSSTRLVAGLHHGVHLRLFPDARGDAG